MSSKDAQCFVGGLFSEKRYTKPVNDKEVNKELKDSHAQATYARLWNAYDEIISGRSRLSPLEKTAAVIERLTGVPVDSVSMFLRNPSGILGDDVVKAVEAIGQDHFHRYKGTDKAAWNQLHKPKIETLRAKVMAGIDPVYADFAKKYFDFYSDGGRMYARRGNLNPVDKLVRNVVGNVVVWNPTIGIMNLSKLHRRD